MSYKNHLRVFKISGGETDYVLAETAKEAHQFLVDNHEEEGAFEDLKIKEMPYDHLSEAVFLIRGKTKFRTIEDAYLDYFYFQDEAPILLASTTMHKIEEVYDPYY